MPPSIHALRASFLRAACLLPALVVAAGCGTGADGPAGDAVTDDEATPASDPSWATAPVPDRGQYAPSGTPVELGLAGFAKVTCSALFVSGRELDEAMRNSGFFFLAPADRDAVTDTVVDREARAVHLTHGDSLTRTARYYGDQGCVLLPRGLDGVFFDPVPVETTLPEPSGRPWPMGDVVSDAPWPDGVDSARVARAVDAAFADPAALTAAFLVVHDGRILAERYGQGAGVHTQLESWSMGKSLTATLVGILIEQGDLALGDPAPVPAWHRDPDDSRRAITVRHLMRMSSGLHFTAPRDPDYTPEMGYPDHMYIYSGAIDAFEYSVSRPLQFEPGSEGRYRNSDPLTLGYVVQRLVEARGQEYLTWPQRALFDRIGIREQVLEPDPYGNFLLTGFDYGTARNWARLGLLYLNEGAWMGERILPEGWAEFVRTPAPAWERPEYGGLFWLNRDGAYGGAPADAYYMAGGGGQRTFVIPSLGLVVVRMGHFRGNEPGQAALDDALGLLTEAFGGTPVEEE